MIKKIFYILLLMVLPFKLIAQTDNISGIVNAYTAVVNIDNCPAFIDVADASEFSVGNKVLIIQMKGAEIDSVSNSSNFGDILNFNESGNYELSRIQSITGNTIQLINSLTRSYDVNYSVQLVRVSEHMNATVTADLTCPAWDGTTGGVLVVDCQNILTLNANITANSTGFRPGVISSNQFDCTPSNDYFYPGTSFFGGRKGEGIADVSNQIINGRGKLANGGGGGNQVNSGGGGGSNFGVGGKGGFGHPVCGVLDMGGLGGQAIPYGGGLDKFFMGGGGGGGQQNDGQATPGTLGGGIIIIVANEIVGNNNSIQSFGIDAISAASDGAGGGGAGGTIAISCNTYTGNVQLDVHGGKGGNASVDHGTAGGGGGGLIYVNSALPANVTTTLVGGNPGVWNGTTNSYGSQGGSVGGILTSFVLNNPVQNSQLKDIIVENTCFFDQTNIYLNDTASLTQLNWLIVESANPSNVILNSNWNGNIVQFPNSGEYIVVAELVYSCYRDTLYDTLNITAVNPIDLGSDTTYCEGAPVLTLDAGAGYDFYFWQGVDTTQTYTADTTGQYIVEVANIGDNLVYNGDFELGNVGFYCQYNYPITGPPDNNYQVSSSINTCTADHTTGTGLFYAAGGYTATNEKAWCQNLDLIAGQKYVLSYYAASFNSPNPALIQFSVDGSLISVSKQLPSTTCQWEPFYEIWESTVTGNVEVCILNQTASYVGNDFMLDDIVIAPLCTKTDTINVTVGELPHADFSLVDSCEYQAVNYTDLSAITAPETITTWSWDIDNDGIEDYNSQNPSHTFAAGTYTTELTVTSAIGCSKDTVMPIVVYEQPQASFTFNNECLYDSVSFIDNSTITAPDMIIGYGWNFGENLTPLVQSIDANPYNTYSTAGTYNVVEVVGSLNGCYDTVVNQVTIYDVPNVSYSVSDTCDNIPIEFTDNTISNTPITTWEWDFGDMNTGSNQNETHTYLTSGSYDTELVVIDDNGCSDTSSLSLTINPTPQVSFNYLNGCLYDTVNFVDASIVNAPDNIVSWSWDIDGDNNEDYSSQNVNHLYNTAGDYNVSLTVESNNSCENTLTEVVSIYAVPQAGFSASTTCVNGDATQFVNTSSISNGTITTFGWDFGDGNISLQENPSNNYLIASSYPVTLGVISDNGCVDSVTYSIEVLGKPSAAYTQDTTSGCPTMCIAFTDTSYDDVPIVRWNWKFENSYGESIDQNPTYCYTTTGTYDVGLIVTNAQGCKDTLDQLGLINIHASPISDFVLSPTSTDVQNSLIEFTNNSADAAAWLWNFGDGSDDDYSNYNPSYAYGDTGHFEVQLIVFNANLCSDTSYQYVEILPVDDIFVPSAFSPNGDGKNDVLYARGYIGVMYFAVFDRLGNKVFESEDKEIGWDGLIKGKNAIEGVYTWYIQAEVNGNAYKLKGDVTLIR